MEEKALNMMRGSKQEIAYGLKKLWQASVICNNFT